MFASNTWTGSVVSACATQATFQIENRPSASSRAMRPSLNASGNVRAIAAAALTRWTTTASRQPPGAEFTALSEPR